MGGGLPAGRSTSRSVRAEGRLPPNLRGAPTRRREPARGGNRWVSRDRYDQSPDRQQAPSRRADRRRPRRAHHEQARLPLSRADRRLDRALYTLPLWGRAGWGPLGLFHDGAPADQPYAGPILNKEVTT